MKSKAILTETTSSLPQGIENSLKTLEETLKEKFPLGVSRKKIGEATGDILNSRTMANQDSLGCGISGAFKVGRQVIYPTQEVVRHIRKRVIANNAA